MPIHKLTEIASRRELFNNLTLRELRSKYKRTVLGLDVVAAQPADQHGHLHVVFGVFLGVKPDAGDPSGLDNFAMFLMCGLLPYNFLVQRPQRRHGLADRQRQPGQEGLLPPRDPGGGQHGVVGGVVPHRAGRAGGGAGLLRQHRRAVDPGRAGARGHPDRVRAGPGAHAGRGRRLLPRPAAPARPRCCRCGSTRRRSCTRCRLVQDRAGRHGLEDHAVQPQPADALRRGLPRRALRHARSRRSTTSPTSSSSRSCPCSPAWSSSAGWRAGWRRSCERRSPSAPTGSGSGSGSTTSATSG